MRRAIRISAGPVRPRAPVRVVRAIIVRVHVRALIVRAARWLIPTGSTDRSDRSHAERQSGFVLRKGPDKILASHKLWGKSSQGIEIKRAAEVEIGGLVVDTDRKQRTLVGPVRR